MGKIINQNKKLVIVTIFTFLMAMVTAAGVVTPYFEENPLRMYPGESTTVELFLQNMVGSDDIILIAEISSEGNIASLVQDDPEYLVPSGTEDIPVPIKIEIPEDIEERGKREVSVSFKRMGDSSGGMVNVISSMTTKIFVEIVGVEESTFFQESDPWNNKNYLYIISGLIILGIIIAWIIHKRKKGKFNYKPKQEKHNFHKKFQFKKNNKKEKTQNHEINKNKPKKISEHPPKQKPNLAKDFLEDSSNKI